MSEKLDLREVDKENLEKEMQNIRRLLQDLGNCNRITEGPLGTLKAWFLLPQKWHMEARRIHVALFGKDGMEQI